MNPLLALTAAALAAASLAAPARADEIDDLAAKVKPEPRYAAYEPDFKAVTKHFTFHHAKGKVEERDLRLVMDGDKYVAALRSGDIMLLAPCPDQAPTGLDFMPTGRLHLDTMPGPSLPTWQFLKPVRSHGSFIYEDGEGGEKGEDGMVHPKDSWEGGGQTLTFVRQVVGDDRNVRHTFEFRVDPVFGYVVDGRYRIGLKDLPAGKKAGFRQGTFCPGCYVPWPEASVYERTVFTPDWTDGVVGYANNLMNMDRVDGNKSKTTWRKNGFIGYLEKDTGWSFVRTRDDSGGVPRMPVCNAHNDFHINIPFPEGLERADDGLFHMRFRHRLMGLPPALTEHVWNAMEMLTLGGPVPIVRIGVLEDFEDQPVALDRPVRGLVWTSHPPALSTEEAHSGKQSLVLVKTSWPNLPQVSLTPKTAYRLEAWMKPVGEGVRGFVKGDFYEWSPHSREWLKEQQTSVAEGGKGWQHVVLDFETPAWDPFINIVFVVEGEGTVYLDDFRLAPR